MNDVALQSGDSLLTEAIASDPSTLGIVLGFYVILLTTSGYVVRAVLSYANIDFKEDSQRRDTGTAIGKVENVLVVSLMLVEAYTALGVIFAAKSLVRKEDIGTGDTTYYLTGTITNFTYSIVVGAVLRLTLWVFIQ